MNPSGSPCCKDKALLLAATAPIANQKLGIFRRLVRGDSFRVLPAEKGAGAGASSSPSGALSKFLPPARILDLSVEVDTEEQQIEFAWTAPGEDYDNGKVCLDASFVLWRIAVRSLPPFLVLRCRSWFLSSPPRLYLTRQPQRIVKKSSLYCPSCFGSNGRRKSSRKTLFFLPPLSICLRNILLL